ncbi:MULTISPECIES: hypothetical protein [unclassified Microcystis]|uniref:hypothetical protein n=1 Tax=unclassified Microcystis TaxID=2643300 RepID=UPI00338F924D
MNWVVGSSRFCVISLTYRGSINLCVLCVLCVFVVPSTCSPERMYLTTCSPERMYLRIHFVHQT